MVEKAPPSGRLNVRVPTPLLERIDRVVEEDGITRTKLTIECLQVGLNLYQRTRIKRDAI